MMKAPFKIIAISAVTALSLYAASQNIELSGNKTAVVDTNQIAKNSKDIYMLKLAIAKIINKIEKLEEDSKNFSLTEKELDSLDNKSFELTLKEILSVIGKDIKDADGNDLIAPDVKELILQKVKMIKEEVEDINSLVNESGDPIKIKQALAKEKFEKEFGQEVPDPNKIFTTKEQIDENLSIMKDELGKAKDRILNKLNNLEQNASQGLNEIKEESINKAKEGEDGLMRLFPVNKKDENLTKDDNKTLSFIIDQSKETIDRNVINDSMAKQAVKDANWSRAKDIFPLLPEEESYDSKRTYGEEGNFYKERDIVASYKNFDAIKKYIILQKPSTKVFDKPVLISWGSKVVDNLKANEVVEVDLFTLSGWLHVKGKGWIKGYFAEEVKS